MSWLGILRLHDWVYRDLFFGSDVFFRRFGVWAGEQKESPHLRSPRGARVGGGRCEVSSVDEEASLALAEELAEGLFDGLDPYEADLAGGGIETGEVALWEDHRSEANALGFENTLLDATHRTDFAR